MAASDKRLMITATWMAAFNGIKLMVPLVMPPSGVVRVSVTGGFRGNRVRSRVRNMVRLEPQLRSVSR